MEEVEHGDIVVTERPSDVASEEIMTSTTDVEEQSQLADGDAILKCFSPLLNSMKVFGLYFTQASRHIHDVFTSTSDTTESRVCKKWNKGRIYAMVILVVFWLNAFSMCREFNKADKFGVLLFMKLSAICATFNSAFQQTACFIACQTGNLDRVFSDVRLPKSDAVRYRRFAVIHTVVCWIFLLADLSLFLFPFFIVGST